MQILFFHGSWCAPCKQTEPHIDTAKCLFPEITFIDVSMDEDSGIEKAQEYNVRSVPTIVFTDDTGEMIQCLRGPQTYEDIEAVIAEIGM